MISLKMTQMTLFTEQNHNKENKPDVTRGGEGV